MKRTQIKYVWHEPVKGWGFHMWIPMMNQERCWICGVFGYDLESGKVRKRITKTKNPPRH